jgi:hypothetical protein
MAEGWQAEERGAGAELYLCPICSTKVSSTAKECPSCHAIFVEEGEAAPPAAPAAPAPPAAPPPGVQYRCPNCDAVVGENDTKCGNCGAIFVETTPAPPARPVPPKATPAKPAAAAPKAAAGVRPAKREGKAPVAPKAGLKVRTKAAQATETRKRRHSKAVERLSVRRRRIAQRRMLGLTAMGGGVALYLGTLILTAGGGFTLVIGAAIGFSILLLGLGVLITYNQFLAERHYREQLEKARVEAALLREMAKGPAAARTAALASAQPPPASPSRAPPVGARTVAPPPTRTWGEERAAPVPETAHAVTAPERTLAEEPEAAQGPASVSSITVEVAPQGADEKDKVACANCGYMNRRIFVRCIRCGTELAKREQSIAVETFDRAEARAETASAKGAGGRTGAPVPWEAKRAQTPTSKAAARAAERKAAIEEAEEAAEDQGQDRRAVIGVAANFPKLPREMREQLIRTLYKVDDPAVRQDVVSAISENYTEVPRDIQELLPDLGDDDDPRVREEVAFEINRNFDRIPLEVVQSIFNKLARDPERMVREDVVSAIAENFSRLPKESQDLLKLLAQDKVESVRDEVSFEIAKNSDVIPEKFKSEVMEHLKRAGGATR